MHEHQASAALSGDAQDHLDEDLGLAAAGACNYEGPAALAFANETAQRFADVFDGLRLVGVELERGHDVTTTFNAPPSAATCSPFHSHARLRCFAESSRAIFVA